MVRFRYVAKDASGKTLKGLVEGNTRDEAIGSLRSKNLIIVSLQQEKESAFSFGALRGTKKKIKMDDLVIFSRQLATMVSAGVPLVGAVDILAEQMENVSFKQITFNVRDDIETGSSLSEALGKHPSVFSNLFVNMVKAGESSGMLDEILDRLASHLEKTSSLQKKIKSAFIYPAAVVTMAVGVTVFLLVKVIPVFKDIYDGFGAKLPTPTLIMINASDFMRKYFAVTIGATVLLGIGIHRYTRTEGGRRRLDTIKLNMPIFGMIIKKIVIAQFTRTLATLIRSGVPILDSLEIVGKTAGNKVVEGAVEQVAANVKEGEPIAEPLSRSGVFPPMVVRMISVGEQTGELEKMLAKISDFYTDQVDAAVSGLTNLIEPLVIAFLGIVIGGIVISMFLPILNITTIVGGGG